jgi:molecular chaperone IbpA
MNRLTTIDLNKLTPHSVGLDRMFNDMFRYVEQPQNAGYPPYNIVQEDERFSIEMALAGVHMEDVDIVVADGVLTITHEAKETNNVVDNEQPTKRWVHRGIAQRSFKRNFTLAEDVIVQGARMENGMLYIDLERIIPDEKKPRKIEISYAT